MGKISLAIGQAKGDCHFAPSIEFHGSNRIVYE